MAQARLSQLQIFFCNSFALWTVLFLCIEDSFHQTRRSSQILRRESTPERNARQNREICQKKYGAFELGLSLAYRLTANIRRQWFTGACERSNRGKRGKFDFLCLLQQSLSTDRLRISHSDKINLPQQSSELISKHGLCPQRGSF